MKLISEETFRAAMDAVEDEAIKRCAAEAKAYGEARQSHPLAGGTKPSSAVAMGKIVAAREIARRIELLPRKSKGTKNGKAD